MLVRAVFAAGVLLEPHSLETILSYIREFLTVFAIAMIPVAELRGAIPIGCTMGMPALETYIVAVAGNMLPVPFIVLFGRKLFKWLETKDNFVSRLVRKRIEISVGKSRKMHGSILVALAVFVAIPLPGTGAWTGAFIAAFLELRLRMAVPAIGAGVLIAGVLILSISYGIRFFAFS